MCESGGGTTIKTILPFSLFQCDDGNGPLKCDEERSAIRLWIYCTYTHMCTWCSCSCTHTHLVESQQASLFLLWECETSPSHSMVPGGNGIEHLANQLQLSPPGLKVSPPTGLIYSQVEREKQESLSLCFSSSQTRWLA